MNSNNHRDTVLNCFVVFAAWLVIIAACLPDDVDAKTQVVRIAYEAQ
jgi:hypothetical protein